MRSTGNGLLERISPIAHLIVVFSQLIPVLLSFDQYTPIPFLALALTQTLVLGRVELVRMLRVMLPLSSLPVGLFLLNLFLSDTTDQEIMTQLWFFTLTRNSLHRAIVIGLRSLSLIVNSIAYLLVTDPLKLVNALMQQLKLSPRVGFSIYVAWNTIPFLRDDLQRIEHTHRIRLRGRRRRVQDALPTAVTLLAGAIRHGERASVSMTTRGLDRSLSRSFIHKSCWTRTDTAYLLISLLIVSGIFAALIVGNFFTFGLG